VVISVQTAFLGNTPAPSTIDFDFTPATKIALSPYGHLEDARIRFGLRLNLMIGIYSSELNLSAWA